VPIVMYLFIFCLCVLFVLLIVGTARPDREFQQGVASPRCNNDSGCRARKIRGRDSGYHTMKRSYHGSNQNSP
jgi:hypothetical protein